MKKILLIIDALNPDENAFQFACYIARLKEAILTGVFLENDLATEAVVVQQMHRSASRVGTDKRDVIRDNIEMFTDACIKKGISFKIHRDRNLPLREILDESRFADLIIMSATTSFENNDTGAITHFVRKVLFHTECPVIIAPVHFEGIDQVVFTYDGSKSSMYAIRQFTYLFPEFKYKNVVILQISNEKTLCITNKYKLKEWLKMHYPNVVLKLEQGAPADELFTWFLHKKQTFAVTGAYSRSAISMFFENSTAETLLRTTTLPVFIAHH